MNLTRAMSSRSPLRSPVVWVLFAAIVLVATVRSLRRERPAPLPALGQVPAFTLTDAAGEPFGSENLSGSVYVASFVFTRCPSLCPMIMHSVQRLQERYRAAGVDGVRLVSFSVDPEHDRPDRLRAYGEEHGVDAQRWKLLTGPKPAVKELLVDGFGVGMGEPMEIGENLIDIAHTGKLVLVDQEGAIRGYFAYDTESDDLFRRSQEILKGY